MASDRGRTLTVRAAVRGVIDFRRAKFREANWWRRVNILLGEVAREDEARVIEASYLYHLALVANGSLEAEGFKAEQKRARDAFNDLVSCTHPWAERVRKMQQLAESKRLKDLYVKLLGDPDDPKTRERWRRESAEFEAKLAVADPATQTMQAVTEAVRKAAEKGRQAAVPLD